ncbi:hypothetical protein LCGC14_2596290 [marine sediment metagenome]|uniref:Uncharacterized protein n=1 Tax=marine sediment metagenome TaxID=412755 RepID=A0A0F9CL45_9ZZZZ
MKYYDISVDFNFQNSPGGFLDNQCAYLRANGQLELLLTRKHNSVDYFVSCKHIDPSSSSSNSFGLAMENFLGYWFEITEKKKMHYVFGVRECYMKEFLIVCQRIVGRGDRMSEFLKSFLG